MKVLNMDQRDDAWFAARRGIPTASNFSKIITSKGEPSKSRLEYIYKLAAARVSGKDEESFTSKSIEAGIAREDESRWVYAMHKGVVVDEVGFILSDDGRYGASPDGLVGTNGLVELKNPLGKTAVEYLLKNRVPPIYFQQVQGQMFVAEREWSDFVCYYPGLPMLVVRVYADEEFFEALEKELTKFCDELDQICYVLERKKERR